MMTPTQQTINGKAKALILEAQRLLTENKITQNDHDILTDIGEIIHSLIAKDANLLSIEEFVNTVGPKLRPGYIAYDECGWYWYDLKPEWLDNEWCVNAHSRDCSYSLDAFNIESHSDPIHSVTKVGNNQQ